jgi:phospholipid N-methyltransferase
MMANSRDRTEKRAARSQPRPGPAPRNPRLQFLRGFLKHPVMVGSIIPSSRTVIEKMLAPVDWEKTKLFVEYGPGVGTFTRPILEKLRKDATLLTIDTNPEFNDFLVQSIDDPRLVAVTGSAADVEKILADRGFKQADYVLSGIPFSTLPPGLGDAIGKATAQVIRPGGATDWPACGEARE